MELDLSENTDFFDKFWFDLLGEASFSFSIVSNFRSGKILLFLWLSVAMEKSALSWLLRILLVVWSC
jgi:hypothetical protein